jgi:hypothetical protein
VPRRNPSYQVRKAVERLARQSRIPQSKVNMSRAMGKTTLRPSATISFGATPGTKVRIIRPGTFEKRSPGELRPTPSIDQAFKALGKAAGKKNSVKPAIIGKGVKRFQ